MTNLLNIEEQLLQSSSVKSVLNLTKVLSLQKHMKVGKAKRFSQSLELSQYVKQGLEWFQSPAGKNIFAASGVSWSTEDFFFKIYGWQKSFGYKMVKAAKIEADEIAEFTTLCEEIEASGEDANRSIDGLLKWHKAKCTQSETGEEAATREATICVFSRKGLNGHTNVSVRLTDTNKVKTVNSKAEILQAIALLAQLVADDSTLA